MILWNEMSIRGVTWVVNVEHGALMITDGILDTDTTLFSCVQQ